MDKKTCVKPKVTLEHITRFVHMRYGLQALKITPLVGFTDLNFLVQVARDQDNDQSDNVEKHCTGYVLKIVGSESLADVDYLEAQGQLIMHLKKSGIPTPGVILNLEKQLFCVEDLPTEDGLSQKIILRLMEYIPGSTFLDAGNPLHLLPEIGKLTGKVDNSLRNFYHPALDIVYDWQLTSVTSLLSLLTILSADQQELGRAVIQAYEDRISPILDTLQRGTCHGDINNCNVIVKGASADDSKQIAGEGNNTDLKIAAVIDFGDSCVGYYVYEIATAVADLMTSCKGQYDPLDVASLVIHGYLSEFQLHEQELRILKLVICVRLLQTYVLSTDMSTRDPDNKYITLEIEDAMETLKFLWKLPDETFQRLVFVDCDNPYVNFQSRKSK
ncbi:hypothetical protein CHS0354_022564 [Potamilus streckersoni]|uniref:Hydroxylysine kinase n=1 Tax=Potamilus streckersoni TaxID=2493646 RepID=A0AAE0TBJ2_9BIVA|nr:hypothetical protein CHS0354_022564 [Potamilus streckersoni]